MCTFSYVKFYVDVDIANICSVLLCPLRTVGWARVACLFRLHFCFFLFLEKMVGIPMQNVLYIILKVDAEIANICFV